MDSINGIPIIWDSEGDKNLFGKVFNKDPFAAFRTNKSFEEISNEYALKSPFGEKSLFSSQPIRQSTNFIKESNTKWLYSTKQHQSGTELLKEYRKYDSLVGESTGNSNDLNDFIIYIEDNYTVNLGKVLLIKMSDKMINHYAENLLKDPKTEILKNWSAIIYEQNKKKEGFSATAEDIENAFLLEIQYRPSVNKGIIKFTNAEIASMVSSQVSVQIRGIKIDRENWDPTLKSDRYKLQSIEKGLDYIITKLNEYKNEVADYRKFLETITKFSFNSITGINQLVKDFILFLKSIEKGITATIQQMQRIRDKGPEYFAFLCGIINGVFEFICGILDVVILIVRLIYTIDTKEKPEYELDILELREGLEELIEAWLKDPDFLSKRIQEMLESYEYARYKDPKLTKFQIAHNTGEDLVLAIDIIVSFIAIIKAITNSSKYLPKFTEWIDEVVENGGKGARMLENTLIDDYIRLSKELVDATKSKTLFQNTNKLDELYEAAKIANEELKTITTNFTKKNKGKPGFRDGLKSKERAIEKIESDYAGDASRLVDIAGSKVVYETVDDLYIALSKFNKEYKIIKIKDRIQKPVNGYRDVLMNIEMKNGHIVEFRLHLKEMDLATEAGHKFYQQRRTLEAISIKRELTIEEQINVSKLEVIEKNLYDEAWNKITNK